MKKNILIPLLSLMLLFFMYMPIASSAGSFKAYDANGNEKYTFSENEVISFVATVSGSAVNNFAFDMGDGLCYPLVKEYEDPPNKYVDYYDAKSGCPSILDETVNHSYPSGMYNVILNYRVLTQFEPVQYENRTFTKIITIDSTPQPGGNQDLSYLIPIITLILN